MKAPVKPCFLLFCLVLGIYVMRDSGTSFGTAFKASVRMLLGPKPSESLCKSTDINQAFSASQLQRAADIRDSVKSMRGGNPLLTLLTSNDLFGQLMPTYVMPTIQYIAPWPILFLLSILTFICVGCNWCCIYGCCKNTKCCKCCKEPKDSGRARIYVAFSVIFLLGVTGASIAGIVVGTQVGTGIEVTICSVLSTVEDFEYGVPSQKWLGVDGTVTSLKNLLAGFDTAVNSMTASSSNMGTVNTNLGNVKSQLNTMITNVNALTKPTRAAPDQAGTYTPSYGANIGPATSSSSYTGAIQAECQTRYDILNTAQSTINSAVSTLTNPATKTGVRSGIQSGVDVTDGISLKIQDLLNSVVQYGGISKDVIKAVGSALTGIFISNLVLGLGTLGSILMVGCCKKNFFNKFLLTNTFMMLALTILGWFIVTIFYPLSLIMLEGCDVLDQITVASDATQAQKTQSQTTMGLIVSTLTNGNGSPAIINQCLYGDGEIVQQFGLDSGLKDFRSIFDQFNNVQNTAGMKIDNVSPPSVTIPYQQDLVAKMKVGTLPDADETVTDLTALNSATNKNNNPCTSVYDTWQLNSGNCAADAGYKFVTADADTKNKPNPTCIGLDAWSGSPPTHTITNRYTAAEFPGSCANRGGTSALTYVQTFVPKFQTNRNKVDTYFGSVQTELGNVATKYQTFADSIKPVLNDFKTLNGTLGGIYDSLAGSNGLLTQLNCKFVATDLKRVSNAMCIGFIATLYQTSVVIIVTSVMTFFASICVFCLGKRFILPKPGGEGKVL